VEIRVHDDRKRADLRLVADSNVLECCDRGTMTNPDVVANFQNCTLSTRKVRLNRT
jgi:hypothetical protein